MRFLKYFESKETSEDLMLKYADDIVRVYVTYDKEFNDDLNYKLSEVVWNTSVGDEYGETGVLTEEMMRRVIEDHKGAWRHSIDQLLNVYYDCKPFVDSLNKDLEKDIQEIFLEYSDVGQVQVSKTSKFRDDRYAVDIRMKDIFFQINFEEVFGRIKDLGFESYHVDGVKNGSTEYMKIEFWKPLPKQDDEE
jgi:hypothetical protein